MAGNPNILIIIGGGVAAYKIPELVRRLRDDGAAVRVIMTQAATAFITPMTLQAVSGHPVGTSLLDPAAEASMGHIELGRWADLIIVAPATADLIARIAHGIANDLATTALLASAAPLLVAPAMNQQMYRAAVTQDNLALLAKRGATLIGPASGSQACGDIGPGRMVEPAELRDAARQLLNPQQDCQGLKLVITAGPTREALDPVRYISNHSSGKMGYALAAAAARRGAEVVLISGPVQLATPTGVTRIDVTTAVEMHQAVQQQLDHCGLFIGCAAVADFRPAHYVDDKIKKQSSDDRLTLELVANPDIIAAVSARPDRPFVVGFAAETSHLLDHARAKRQRKGMDLIVANDVGVSGIGFNSDDNAVVLLDGASEEQLPVMPKATLADQLISRVLARMPNAGARS
ncbi:MAG: bifunctional phosphopantothenoylcysteine decarboxylase/phosphopantothenate--cysteine ligase CoaBC [Gammaproteobacteria bacterium]|nr:bifunctional phosphopantothenoylcysteine decarboxylase/phosphopantothenate--cysteine ligase CoaBC [Gammaproteobacteria bacterium]